MNTPVNTVPAPLDVQTIPPAAFSIHHVPSSGPCDVRSWENRSIYIAPLAAAAIFLIGFLISNIHLSRPTPAISIADPAKQYQTNGGAFVVMTSYDSIAGLLMLTAMIVGCSIASTR